MKNRYFNKLKLLTYLLAILLMLLNLSISFATSSEGNSGLIFLGFSKDGNKISYLKFFEHYGRFNDFESNVYHREYLGSFIYDINLSTETIYRRYFDFGIPGFEIYSGKNDEYRKKYNKVYNKFKFDELGEIYFDNELIYKNCFLSEVMFVGIVKDFERIILHIRFMERGEFYDKIFLFNASKKKLKELISTF